MSGGYFDYGQWWLVDMAEKLEGLVVKERSEEDPGDGFRHDFTDETLKTLELTAGLLRRVFVLAHSADYLLSGDHGEESFHREIAEDLPDLQYLLKGETG